MASVAGEAGNSPASAAGGLRAKVLHGGAYLFFRQFFSLGLSLLGVVIVTRVIGPERYGAYVAAIGIYLYLQDLGQAGVDVFLVRQQGDMAERMFHVASTLLLAMGVFEIVVVQIGAGPLAGWVQVAGFEPLLRVLILILPLQLMTIGASARLERALDYRRIAAIELSGQAAFYLVAVPLAIGGYGSWSLVAGWCVQQAGVCLVFHWTAGYLPRLRFDRTIAGAILSYTLGYSLASWAWQLRALVNPLIVGHFLGATSVGQVGMCIRIVEVLTFVKAIAWRLSVAILSRIQHDRLKLQEAVTQGVQLQTLALAPILLGFSWVGGLVLPQLFGARWAPVLDVYPFIALSYLTNAQFNLHSAVLAVLRRNHRITLFNLSHVVLFAAGAAVLVPALGLTGYGWAELVALPGYLVIHHLTVGVIGPINYRVAGVWWAGAVLGLFWHRLGVWSIAMPFAVLLWPGSVRRLQELYFAFRPRRRVAGVSGVAASG
jgi:O-antigen/teichoic acid export membrane protein